MKSFRSLSTILALLMFISLVLAIPALAQETNDVAADENITAEDLGVAEPTDGLFGFFQNVASSFQYALTFDPVKKAELKIKHASKVLLRAQNALENNPDSDQVQEKYDKFLEKYEKTMVQVQEKIQAIKEKAGENPKVDQLLTQLTDNTFKQQRLMDHVSGLLDEGQQVKLQEKRAQSLKTMGEALKSLEDAEKIPERLENAINNQVGSSLINLKNLEVLAGLKNQLPEQALKGIENAQAKTLNRLNEALQNYDPKIRREKFQAYSENSNSDPLTQFEVLNVLEQAPNLLLEIKQNLPAIKNDKVEKIDKMIDAFKNDEDKIKNLERIRNIENPQTKTMLRQIEQKYVNSEASVNQPLKIDDLKEAVRNVYKANEMPVMIQEKVENGADKIKDVINQPPDNAALNENIKDATGQANEGEMPVMMQERSEAGNNNNDANRERPENAGEDSQIQPTQPEETGNNNQPSD